MTTLDILNAPWAIQPSKLEEIQAIYAAHARGEKADLAAIEARLGRPMANEDKRYEVIDGVAVLPIEGVIGKKMNLFSAISGGASSQLIGRDVRDALANDQVHSIVLAIDSPGGTVDGTPALGDIVRAARGIKPIVALADGTMASAAYWIGSAADSVYMADITTEVGSIGVVAKHVDVSGAEAQRGIRTTEITAGKFKRSASQYRPLDAAGLKTIQDQVDYVYSLFVSAVATNLGVSEDRVLADMADGRVFRGQQAIDVGLVSGFRTLDALVEQLNRERSAKRGRASSSRVSTTAPAKGANAMSITREQIAADAPEVLAAIQTEGAAAERARIQGVEAQCLPGHEKLIGTLKFDGKSTGGDAAMAVLAAEGKLRTTAAQALANDAPAAVRQAAADPLDGAGNAGDGKAPSANGKKTKVQMTAEATTLAAKDGISFSAAFKKLGFEYA